MNEFEFVQLNAEGDDSVAIDKNSQLKQAYVSPDNITLESFIIRPLKVGEIALHLLVESNDITLNKELKEIIQVKAKGQPQVFNKMVLLNLNSETPEIVFDSNVIMSENAVDKTKKITLDATNDILNIANAALNYLHEHDPLNQILSRASISTTILEHLSTKDDLDFTIKEKAQEALEQSYSQLMVYGKNGTFKHKNQNINGSTWLTANILHLFLRAKQFVFIDEFSIKESIEFLRTRQLQNGSFLDEDFLVKRRLAYVYSVGELSESQTFHVLDAHVLRKFNVLSIEINILSYIFYVCYSLIAISCAKKSYQQKCF